MQDRSIRRKLESAFYNYDNNLKIGTEYIREQYTSGLTSRIGCIGHSSGVSDPTGEKAVRALEGSSAALWCKVVDNTMTTFRWEIEAKIIELRYFQRWNDVKAYMFLHIPERTFYFLLEKVINIAEQWAREYKLL